MRAGVWRVGGIAAAAVGIWASSAGAAAAEYAPLNHRGPRLSVPAKQLKAALQCTASVASDPREPILLVPGTTMTPEVKFTSNYAPALTPLGLPRSPVELPTHAMSDIQVTGLSVHYPQRWTSTYVC